MNYNIPLEKVCELGQLLRNKKAALIDMDGVLYDSMRWHSKAWRETMLELGIDRPEKDFYLYEGMTGEATINLILSEERGETFSPEECRRIYAGKSDRFKAMGEVAVMPGAQEMIALLGEAGLRRVLVTGSAQSSLLSRLVEDYDGAFPNDMRVTALDVKRGKPDPEPYLRGLEKAGVSAEDAIVIENAPLGVRSGKRAGIFTIAVMTGPIPRETFETEGADMIFESMPAFAAAIRERI